MHRFWFNMHWIWGTRLAGSRERNRKVCRFFIYLFIYFSIGRKRGFLLCWCGDPFLEVCTRLTDRHVPINGEEYRSRCIKVCSSRTGRRREQAARPDKTEFQLRLDRSSAMTRGQVSQIGFCVWNKLQMRWVWNSSSQAGMKEKDSLWAGNVGCVGKMKI